MTRHTTPCSTPARGFGTDIHPRKQDGRRNRNPLPPNGRRRLGDGRSALALRVFVFGVVLDFRGGSVRLDRLDALLGCGLRLMPLAARDDLPAKFEIFKSNPEISGSTSKRPMGPSGAPLIEVDAEHVSSGWSELDCDVDLPRNSGGTEQVPSQGTSKHVCNKPFVGQSEEQLTLKSQFGSSATSHSRDHSGD
jgi:hypothetical protein